MLYAEAAYFDGNHCQHCADREESRRIERIRAQGRAIMRQRRTPRGISPLFDGIAVGD